MVAYNFQARFAADVEAGRKLQTIRADGKRRHARAGELVQLFTGMRRPECRLLGLGICTAIWRVRLSFYPTPKVKMILLDAHGDWLALLTKTTPRELDRFAKTDGFSDWDALSDFFIQPPDAYPFEGTLIRWQLDPAWEKRAAKLRPPF